MSLRPYNYIRVRNDLGAESPNWRDHSKELQKKTAEPLSCSQFLSNGMILIASAWSPDNYNLEFYHRVG